MSMCRIPCRIGERDGGVSSKSSTAVVGTRSNDHVLVVVVVVVRPTDLTDCESGACVRELPELKTNCPTCSGPSSLPH